MVKVIPTSTTLGLLLQMLLVNCHHVTYRKAGPRIIDPFPQPTKGYGYLITAGESVYLPPNGIGNIKTGLHFDIPSGIYGYVTTWDPILYTTYSVRTAIIGTTDQSGLVVSLLNHSNTTKHIEPWNIVCRLTFHEIGSIELRSAEELEGKTSCPCLVKPVVEQTINTQGSFSNTDYRIPTGDTFVVSSITKAVKIDEPFFLTETEKEIPKQAVEIQRLSVTEEAADKEEEWPSWF